jgi:hypothetical protein
VTVVPESVFVPESVVVVVPESVVVVVPESVVLVPESFPGFPLEAGVLLLEQATATRAAFAARRVAITRIRRLILVTSSR